MKAEAPAGRRTRAATDAAEGQGWFGSAGRSRLPSEIGGPYGGPKTGRHTSRSPSGPSQEMEEVVIDLLHMRSQQCCQFFSYGSELRIVVDVDLFVGVRIEIEHLDGHPRK